MENPFDQFDAAPDQQMAATVAANPFDQFDATPDDLVARNQAADEAMVSPEGQKLEGELRTRADKILLKAAGAESPIYATLSNAANMATLSGARNLKAGIMSLQSGKPFEQEYSYIRDIDEAAARESPIAAGIGTAAGIGSQIAMLPVAGPATTGARALIGGAEGAALAGGSELLDTKDPEQALQQAAIGGAIGGVAAPAIEGAISGTANAAGRLVQKKPVVPSIDELKSASQAAYDAADSAGVVVNREGIRGVTNEVKGALANEAYHPKNQPKLSNFLSELESLSVGRAVPGQPRDIGVTLSGLESTRKMLRAARSSTDAEERRMAAIATDKFDDYLANIKPSEITAGDAKAGVAALEEARSLWSTFRKADMVEDALQKAETRASTTGSGGNVNNAIRQEFRKILDNKKKSAGFTSAERKALATVANGTRYQNILRLLGSASPTGGGLGMMLNLGAAGASGGLSLLGTAGAMAARTAANNATRANVDRLGKIIRARGLDIDPNDLVKGVQADTMRKFFMSIGVNPVHLSPDEVESGENIVAPEMYPSDDSRAFAAR